MVTEWPTLGKDQWEARGGTSAVTKVWRVLKLWPLPLEERITVQGEVVVY